MQIGNGEVVKVMMGTHTLYDRSLQDASWIECPDEGIDGQDFKGLTLMKWDSTTNTARFKSSAKVTVPGYYTPSNPLKRLAITLPNGYIFTKNRETAIFYSPYQSYGVSKDPYSITTEDNKLFVQLTNSYMNPNDFFICEVKPNTSFETEFNAEVRFNVEKII